MSQPAPFHVFHAHTEANIDHAALITGFHNYRGHPDTRKTHLINNRYENIYLTETQLPALTPLLIHARHCAARLLSQQGNTTPITRIGHWFNAMPPGSHTSRHDHNDGDELLSGVYYIDVPDHSGDLLIHSDTDIYSHTPEAGQLVLFKPDIEHEVEINASKYMRLSIGLNFLSAAPE